MRDQVPHPYKTVGKIMVFREEVGRQYSEQNSSKDHLNLICP
jgi:hypothetical protein